MPEASGIPDASLMTRALEVFAWPTQLAVQATAGAQTPSALQASA